MKRTRTPTDARNRSAERAAAIGRLQRWATAPEQETDSVALDVLALLEECRRLCDMVPLAERQKVDAAIMRGAVNSYRAEHARLRELVNDATN